MTEKKDDDRETAECLPKRRVQRLSFLATTSEFQHIGLRSRMQVRHEVPPSLFWT